MKSLTRSLPNRIRNRIRNLVSYISKSPASIAFSSFGSVLKRWASKLSQSLRSVLKTRPRKTRRLKPIHLAIVAIVASVAFGVWRYSTPRLPVYYVAYVGRDRPIFDEFHVRVLQKYLDELNEELPDKRIELKVFGNHQSGEGSRQVYEEILNDPRILLAVDNTWGRELQSVSRRCSSIAVFDHRSLESIQRLTPLAIH